MRFSVLIALVAGECYNENDFYEGTATNANCEPWSESEWAWPDMYSIHKRDGNYCRQRYPGETPWCYGNYMNIGASSYHWCDVEKCPTPRDTSPRRYASYEATVASYEDNDSAPETDFGFGQSFGGDRPTGQDDYSMQIRIPSTTSTYKRTTTTMTTTTSTTRMRTTRATTTRTWSFQAGVKLDRGPRPVATAASTARIMKINNAAEAPARRLTKGTPEIAPAEVLEESTDDSESAVKHTAENSQGQLSVEVPKSVQSIILNIGTTSTIMMIMEIMVCSILVASFLVFSVLLCKGLRVNTSMAASRDVKKMPTELNAMRMKLDTLRDAFVNSSNLNTITSGSCIGINNTSFAQEKPDV